MIQNALSSTHGSKDPECARINSCGVQSVRNKFSRFGELGLNNEAKASRFEPNLSLSAKQDVLCNINTFIENNGYSPTVRELCEMCGVRSSSTMMNRMNRLRDLGYISWVQQTPRTIRILRVL